MASEQLSQGRFRDLQDWKEAREFRVKLANLTKTFPLDKI